MSQSINSASALRATIALSVTQIIGWATTFNLPAVLGRPMAADIGLSTSAAFGASTAFLIALAITSPLLAPALLRFGAQPMLVAGSVLTTIALGILSQCQTAVVYFAIWCVLGACGAMMLTTPAHTRLSELMGPAAKRWITALMLISGLSASIGFPVTEFLLQQAGWRATVLLFALANLVVCSPLHLWATGPSRWRSQAPASSHVVTPQEKFTLDTRQKRVFALLCATVSLIGFVTWGLSVTIIELFKALGLSPLQALSLATFIGVVQVGARAVEFLLAPKASALVTGTIATIAIPIAFVILLTGAGTAWSAWIFVIVYGLASGSMSIARATLPLELFEPRAYGHYMSRLSLPMYLSFAAAAPMFIWLIETYGARSAAFFALAASSLALGSMLLLRANHHQPQTAASATN